MKKEFAIKKYDIAELKESIRDYTGLDAGNMKKTELFDMVLSLTRDYEIYAYSFDKRHFDVLRRLRNGESILVSKVEKNIREDLVLHYLINFRNRRLEIIETQEPLIDEILNNEKHLLRCNLILSIAIGMIYHHGIVPYDKLIQMLNKAGVSDINSINDVALVTDKDFVGSDVIFYDHKRNVIKLRSFFSDEDVYRETLNMLEIVPFKLLDVEDYIAIYDHGYTDRFPIFQKIKDLFFPSVRYSVDSFMFLVSRTMYSQKHTPFATNIIRYAEDHFQWNVKDEYFINYCGMLLEAVYDSFKIAPSWKYVGYSEVEFMEILRLRYDTGMDVDELESDSEDLFNKKEKNNFTS